MTTKEKPLALKKSVVVYPTALRNVTLTFSQLPNKGYYTLSKGIASLPIISGTGLAPSINGEHDNELKVRNTLLISGVTDKLVTVDDNLKTVKIDISKVDKQSLYEARKRYLSESSFLGLETEQGLKSKLFIDIVPIGTVFIEKGTQVVDFNEL